jgi:hypothetical protein
MAAAGKLIIYYGIPSGVNRLWQDDQAATFFTNWDLVVFGAGLELTSHTYHGATRNVIRSLRSQKPAVTVFGYVDLGVTTSNFSIAEIRGRIGRWQDLGANGILLDGAGYDFQVTRERLNTVVDDAHARGLPVCVNSWVVDNVLSPAHHPQFNPMGLPTRLGMGDYCLLESLLVNTRAYRDGYETLANLKARAETAIRYRKSLGIKVMGAGVVDFAAFSPARHGQFFRMVETAAMIFALDAYGVCAAQYSAAEPNHGVAHLFPYHSGFGDVYDLDVSLALDHNATELRRGTDMILHVDHDARAYWCHAAIAVT